MKSLFVIMSALMGATSAVVEEPCVNHHPIARETLYQDSKKLVTWQLGRNNIH